MTHYEILGVELWATREEIKKAWRRLISENHPDRAGNSVLRRAQEINAAYQVLKDPASKRSYDFRIGNTGVKPPGEKGCPFDRTNGFGGNRDHSGFWAGAKQEEEFRKRSKQEEERNPLDRLRERFQIWSEIRKQRGYKRGWMEHQFTGEGFGKTYREWIEFGRLMGYQRMRARYRWEEHSREGMWEEWNH